MRSALTVVIGLSVALTAVWAVAQDQETPASTSQAATSQPAKPPTLRSPEQVEIIKNLLQESDSSNLVPPRSAGDASNTTHQPGTGDADLLPDGAIIAERPGRYTHERNRPEFVFLAVGEEIQPRTMELLPNQLLEAMEREVARGVTEFVISARVTQYRERNYLLLIKLLRRVDNGNLTP